MPLTGAGTLLSGEYIHIPCGFPFPSKDIAPKSIALAMFSLLYVTYVEH